MKKIKDLIGVLFKFNTCENTHMTAVTFVMLGCM